jgi:LPPG:FO 2-phospho-L-lactate transferase
MILALAGGVGGAKLAHGLTMQLPPEKLLVVVNTGDDFTHLGFHISPDVDTVMYWLAGLHDPVQGWGLAHETWNVMGALELLGGATWFNLGDRDLATHILRTQRLARGETLSQVTNYLCERLGIAHRIAPMSDQRVRRIVHTADGPLEFQDYFVRLRCAPAVTNIEFDGAQQASPSPALAQSFSNSTLESVIICPSNPMLSIDPVLAIPGVREWLQSTNATVVAVSPIVGGRAIKGPRPKSFMNSDETHRLSRSLNITAASLMVSLSTALTAGHVRRLNPSACT